MAEDWSETDLRMMRRALELAERGLGWTSPNPLVGAVVSRGDEILGEGFHPKVGEPHAEPIALDQAGERARGATLYVTLEPCAHTGRTPPCLDRVLASGVSRVVIAMEDPDPRTAGRSIRTLGEKGLEVSVGLFEKEARRLNRPFLSRVLRGRPWVTLKYAMTLDGRIATSTMESKWISNEASRAVVHELRSRRRAILVGWRTSRIDDPQLTVRGDFDPPPRQPIRIVYGGDEGLAEGSNLIKSLSESPVIHVVPIASTVNDPEGVETLRVSGTDLFSPEAVSSFLAELQRREIDSLLVEGGAKTLTAFLEAGAADEIAAFVAPRILNEATAVSPFLGSGVGRSITECLELTDVETRGLDGDVMVRGCLNPI